MPKYRILVNGTFNNIKSIYSNYLFNLKIKCTICNKLKNKRVNLVGKDFDTIKNQKSSNSYKMNNHIDPMVETQYEKSNFQSPVIRNVGMNHHEIENKKQNRKLQNQKYNLSARCDDCKIIMRIKIRDIDKKNDILSEKNKATNAKRSKRKNKYKIEYEEIKTNTLVKQNPSELVDEKNEMISQINKIPIMPQINNSFIIAIFDTRNCELQDEIYSELNVLNNQNEIFEKIHLDEGNWIQNNCSIEDMSISYEII